MNISFASLDVWINILFEVISSPLFPIIFFLKGLKSIAQLLPLNWIVLCLADRLHLAINAYCSEYPETLINFIQHWIMLTARNIMNIDKLHSAIDIAYCSEYQNCGMGGKTWDCEGTSGRLRLWGDKWLLWDWLRRWDCERTEDWDCEGTSEKTVRGRVTVSETRRFETTEMRRETVRLTVNVVRRLRLLLRMLHLAFTQWGPC